MVGKLKCVTVTTGGHGESGRAANRGPDRFVEVRVTKDSEELILVWLCSRWAGGDCNLVLGR